jgi:hypothetical protein
MKDTCLNGMNDIEAISPLRGLVSDGGEFTSTKIGQLRCRNAHARSIYASEFQSIMKTTTTLFSTICVLFLTCETSINKMKHRLKFYCVFYWQNSLITLFAGINPDSSAFFKSMHPLSFCPVNNLKAPL